MSAYTARRYHVNPSQTVGTKTQNQVRQFIDAQKHHWTNWWEELCGEMIPNWRPLADIYEDGNRIIVEMDIPGVNPQDIDIEVHRNSVVARGKKVMIREKHDENYHKWERDMGSFIRTVRLPYDIEQDTVQVSDMFGVLRITMHRREKNK